MLSEEFIQELTPLRGAFVALYRKGSKRGGAIHGSLYRGWTYSSDWCVYGRRLGNRTMRMQTFVVKEGDVVVPDLDRSRYRPFYRRNTPAYHRVYP